MKLKKIYKWLFLLLFLTFIGIVLFYSLRLVNYNNKTVYGDRLEGIEEVVVKEDLKNDVINSLILLEDVKEASIDIRGRIINVIIEVTQTVDHNRAIKIVDDMLVKWSDEQINFYDMQFFVRWEIVEEDTRVPIIGYKSRYSPMIVWDGN